MSSGVETCIRFSTPLEVTLSCELHKNKKGTLSVPFFIYKN